MDITLDRRIVLPELIPNPEDFLLVGGLAGSARDLAGYTKESDNQITLGGAMGGAVPLALGMALAAPEEEVLVVTGDGELIMSLGVLATVASMMPDNLTIVCLDNGVHGETGGQPGHTSRRTDLAKVADGSGIPSVMTVVSPDDFKKARTFIAEAQAPRFLWVRVMPGPPTDYRRDWDLAACRLSFRNAYLARKGAG